MKLNETTINIATVINEIFSYLIKNNKNENNDNIISLMLISKQVNFNFIFIDTSKQVINNEIMIRQQVEKYILELADNIGFKPIYILLKKIDINITKISFDIEKKFINIFTKNSHSSISGKNLSFRTQKVLEILYKLMSLFKNGGIMLIDEIENGLHLSLIKSIVSMFEDKNIHYGKVQLFLAIHNPLIFEQKIVLPLNVYMIKNNDFEKFVKSKNYFNVFFWLKDNQEMRSTLSDIAMQQIINEFQIRLEWQK